MVRLLADENFHGDVTDGLFARRPELDLIRVQDIGLSNADDPTVLAWAATDGRVLLTHDKATIPTHAYDRVRAGEPMPGVFVAHGMTVRDIIDEVLILDAASEQAEWADQVVFLPLR